MTDELTERQAAFTTAFARAKEERPRLFDLEADPPAEPSEIDQTQEDLSAEFPADYRWFVQRFGGGDFGFAAILAVGQASDHNIVRSQPEKGVGRFIAVFDDGTGNHYGFPVHEGVCADRITILDHETGQLRDSRYDGFLDFVEHVAFRPAGA